METCNTAHVDKKRFSETGARTFGIWVLKKCFLWIRTSGGRKWDLGMIKIKGKEMAFTA